MSEKVFVAKIECEDAGICVYPEKDAFLDFAQAVFENPEDAMELGEMTLSFVWLDKNELEVLPQLKDIEP